MGSSIHISEYGGDCQFCGKATTHDRRFHDYFPDVPMVASVEGTNGVICSVCAEDPESFSAPHVGSGALMDISKGTDLSSFTTSELTKSSAIHGDFDTASLDYSGKQNLEVRAAESDEQDYYTSCPKCGYEPPFYEIGDELDDGSVIQTEEEAHDETMFYLYENHPDYCPGGWDGEEVAECGDCGRPATHSARGGTVTRCDRCWPGDDFFDAEKVVCNKCKGTGRNLPDGKKIYKTKIGVCSHCDGNGFWREAEFAVDWGLTPTPFCRKVEKTQRWDDGRYSCNSKKGHAGLCGNWSRSSSGRVSFEGHEPCKHIIAGTLDCGCILGDGVDDSTATRISEGLSRVFGKRKKNAEPYPFDETDCAICLKPFYTSMDGSRCLGCDEMFCDDHYDMDKEMCISCSGSESHDAESDGVKRSCNRNITKHCKDYTLGWVNCPACGQPYTEEDVVKAESFAAPTGYNEQGPRPFYGNARKMALDRWGNRRFIRRRKDGTYMKNVDVGRSLSMDRRRKSKTWAPAGFRDQGDGSPSLLMRLLDMFKGVDEEVLMAESDLLCDEHDDYCESCGCAAYDSETDAYIYAYNDGHTDARNQSGYNPTTSAVEITSFKKIRKQAEESDGYWFEEYNNVVIPKNPTEMQEDMLEAFSEYDWYDPKPNDTLVQGLAIAEDPNFHKIYLACAQQDGIIDSSHPAEAYIIAIKVWNALYQ